MVDADLARQTSEWLQAHAVSTVRTEGVTLDGVVIGKQVSRQKFERAVAADGVAINELVAYGLDLAETPYVGWWGDWRHPEFGDILQRPDPSTLVLLPG